MFKLNNWGAGANNIAQATRLPEGTARALVNLDPAVGGELTLRAPYHKAADCTDCRGAFTVGSRVVLIDGDRALAFDPATDSTEEIGTGVGAGPVVGALFGNGQVYFCTPATQHRSDGYSLKRWDVPAPAFRVTELPGGTLTGTYKVAVTALGDDGEESGADPQVIQLSGGTLQVRSDDPRPLRLYVSAVNTATLYSQGRLIGGVAVVTQPDDSGARLTTDGLVPMPACERLVSHHGVLVGAIGKHVFISSPLLPHLTDPERGFFMLERVVCALAAVDGGVFVATDDRTYFLSGVESDAPMQRLVDSVGAVAGTATSLPDGSAAWFTRHGLAIGAPEGSVTYPNRNRYAPEIASQGASGVVEHNGNRMVVTTQRGAARTNSLAAGDFAELE